MLPISILLLTATDAHIFSVSLHMFSKPCALLTALIVLTAIFIIMYC